MSTEIEATFTDIDKAAIRDMLADIGAECIQPERVMRRMVYNPPEKDRDWFRVRDEGDKVTLSYKKLHSRDVDGVEENETRVDDFDETCRLLERTGVIFGAYQETKRESWKLDGVEIEIDEWPWIPPFVEIEGKDTKSVQAIAEQLGFVWEQALFGSVENVYQQHYDVTEQEVNSWPEITFCPVPAWLAAKRRS